MRRSHLEAMQPLCLVCASSGRQSTLSLASVSREEDELVLEGILHCSEPTCQREYPILDGMPLLVADGRTYVADNTSLIWQRDDFSAETESLLGDCSGPNSSWGTVRQHLSSYTWDHYADLDPEEPEGPFPPGQIARLVQRGIELASPWPRDGLVLDLGCSLGRATRELATGSESGAGSKSGLVLGADLNYAMLQVASRALQTGEVRYPRRRVGLVYDRRRFLVEFPGRNRMDFWILDAMAVPFAAEQFDGVVALNVLDCVASPLQLLLEISRLLRPGGKAILASPYDWSIGATPVEHWLGGHSQRGPGGGSSVELVSRLLTPGAHPNSVAGLELVAEADGLPWHVRLHDRGLMQYQVHLLVAEKR